MFDFNSVANFDNHISNSIPNYYGLDSIFKSLVASYLQPSGTLIDVGCSTGRFIRECPHVVNATYTGIDTVDIRTSGGWDFIKSPASEYLPNVPDADVVVLMFVLQFMGRTERSEVIEELKRLVAGGTKLLVSEKVLLNCGVESIVKSAHIQQKRKHFTDTEILDKEYSLVDSMFCLSYADLITELSSIGDVQPVWQSYNFCGFVVTK